MEKKGQITIVIIMVILLLIIFSVMFYIQRSSQEQKSDEQRKAVQLSQEKIDPLNEFVTSCLDISAKAALTDMGKQGGYLYQSQKGPIKDFTDLEFGKKFITYDGKQVAFAIQPPVGDLGFWSSTPPLYPWSTFPEVHNMSMNLSNQSMLNASITQGYFGRNILPNLEKPFTNSMQEQLEKTVAANSADCLNLDNFETQSLTITRGEPVVNVTLTENQVIFDLKYPLTILENRTGATGFLDTFAAKYDVRLKKIIEFMEKTSNLDVTDADFNMSNVTSGVITSWVEEDVSRDDDIVFIRDQNSKILGKPFTFAYARKNRAPALSWFNSTKNKEQFDIHNFVLCGVFAQGSLQGPILRIEDTNLVLQQQHSSCEYPTTTMPLTTYDPDEDDLEYVIVVNREEHTEYQLKEREVGVQFLFEIKVKDDSLFDSESMAFKTMAITP